MNDRRVKALTIAFAAIALLAFLEAETRLISSLSKSWISIDSIATEKNSIDASVNPRDVYLPVLKNNRWVTLHQDRQPSAVFGFFSGEGLCRLFSPSSLFAIEPYSESAALRIENSKSGRNLSEGYDGGRAFARHVAWAGIAPALTNEDIEHIISIGDNFVEYTGRPNATSEAPTLVFRLEQNSRSFAYTSRVIMSDKHRSLGLQSKEQRKNLTPGCDGSIPEQVIRYVLEGAFALETSSLSAGHAIQLPAGDANVQVGVAAFEREDYETALFAFRSEAERGNAEAQRHLARMYLEGRGVERDNAEAVRWYRQAAEQGDSVSQLNLGVKYQLGEVVERSDTEAVKWYALAAEQGNAVAQNFLGLMYSSGQGVERDDAEAVRWFRQASEQGLSVSQRNLAYMYVHGMGVDRDDAEAVRWFRRAADQGDAEAQTALGVMYAQGRGVERDDIEAMRWFVLAADQGHEEAGHMAEEHFEAFATSDREAGETFILREMESVYGIETVALAARGAEEWMGRGGAKVCRSLGVNSGRQLLALPFLPTPPRFRNTVAHEWDEGVKDVWNNYSPCLLGVPAAGLFFEIAVDIDSAKAAGLISSEAIQRRDQGCRATSDLTEREKASLTGDRLRQLYVPCVEAVLEFVAPFTAFAK